MVRSTVPPSAAYSSSSRQTERRASTSRPRRRLVEEDGARPPREGERDREPAALAPGETAGLPARDRGQAEALEQLASSARERRSAPGPGRRSRPSRRVGGNPHSCGVTPIAARDGGERGSPPNSSARPASGRLRPRRIESAVVFPAPFGPSSATTSPASIARSTESRAVRPPKRFGDGVECCGDHELRPVRARPGPPDRRRRCRTRAPGSPPPDLRRGTRRRSCTPVTQWSTLRLPSERACQRAKPALVVARAATRPGAGKERSERKPTPEDLLEGGADRPGKARARALPVAAPWGRRGVPARATKSARPTHAPDDGRRRRRTDRAPCRQADGRRCDERRRPAA